MDNGKIKVIYPQENYMTPLQKLLSLPNVAQYLKPGITPENLEQQAKQFSPNQAAIQMQQAKRKFLSIALPRQNLIQ